MTVKRAKPTRRGFLQIMGMTPFAAHGLSDEAVAELSRTEFLGVKPSPAHEGQVLSVNPVDSLEQAKYWKAAWQLPHLRKEIESLLYENNREVHSIDPDLAVKKSFSYMAKVTFQRQRNVEKDLQEDYFDETPWAKRRSLMKRLIEKFVGPFTGL